MYDLNNLMKEIIKLSYMNMGRGFQIKGEEFHKSVNYSCEKKFLSHYWKYSGQYGSYDKMDEYERGLRKLPKGVTFEKTEEKRDERKTTPMKEFAHATFLYTTRYVINVSDAYSSSVYQPGLRVVLITKVSNKAYARAMEFKEKIKYKYPDLVQKLAENCRHSNLTYNGATGSEYHVYLFSEAGLKPLSSMDDLLGVAFAAAEACIMNSNNNEIVFLEIHEKEKYLDERISFDFRTVTTPVTLSDW